MTTGKISNRLPKKFAGMTAEQSRRTASRFEILNSVNSKRTAEMLQILEFAKQNPPKQRQQIIAVNSDVLKRHQAVISRNVQRTISLASKVVDAKKHFDKSLRAALARTDGSAESVIKTYRKYGGEGLENLAGYQKERLASLENIKSKLPVRQPLTSRRIRLLDQNGTEVSILKQKKFQGFGEIKASSHSVTFMGIEKVDYDEEAIRRLILADKTRNFKPETTNYEDWFESERKKIKNRYDDYSTDISKHRTAIDSTKSGMSSVSDIIKSNLKGIREKALNDAKSEDRTVRFGERDDISEMRSRSKKSKKHTQPASPDAINKTPPIENPQVGKTRNPVSQPTQTVSLDDIIDVTTKRTNTPNIKPANEIRQTPKINRATIGAPVTVESLNRLYANDKTWHGKLNVFSGDTARLIGKASLYGGIAMAIRDYRNAIGTEDQTFAGANLVLTTAAAAPDLLQSAQLLHGNSAGKVTAFNSAIGTTSMALPVLYSSYKAGKKQGQLFGFDRATAKAAGSALGGIATVLMTGAIAGRFSKGGYPVISGASAILRTGAGAIMPMITSSYTADIADRTYSRVYGDKTE